MKKTARKICLAALVAAILFGGACNRSSQSPESYERPGAVDPATIAFLKANKLLGKPVLMEFGILGCELSDEGLATMIQWHGNDFFSGLAYVRVEASKNDEAVAEYYQDKSPGKGFLIHRDSDRKLAYAFNATAYPVFLLIDKFGNTRYAGSFPDENIGKWSEMLLAEKADLGPNAPRLGVKTLNGPELLAETKLPELGGGDKPLADYMGAKGLMLFFGDTSCEFCEKAIKDLPEISQKLAKSQISTVVVNINDIEELVREYYPKLKLNVPIVYDAGRDVQLSWDIRAVPTIILFSPQGKIVYNGQPVWGEMGTAGEKALGLPNGALQFKAKGTRAA